MPDAGIIALVWSKDCFATLDSSKDCFAALDLSKDCFAALDLSKDCFAALAMTPVAVSLRAQRSNLDMIEPPSARDSQTAHALRVNDNRHR